MNNLELLASTKQYSDMPGPKEMEMLMQYCEVMSKAPAYRSMGGMPGIFALVMTARELGIGPMTALNGGMHLIPPGVDRTTGQAKGSPVIMMAAKTMSMMIWKSGHKIEEIECNDNCVTLKGTRVDSGVSMTVTMTLEKAKKAQLSHDGYGKEKLWSPWYKNREDMLWKTCVAKLGRRLFTDVIGNAYEPAEFEEKEAVVSTEKTEKKQLKGKNIPVIEQKEPESIKEDSDLKEKIKEFSQKNLLNADSEERNESMIEFIIEVGVKKKLNFDQMLEYCYKNQEGFFVSYESWRREKEKVACA